RQAIWASYCSPTFTNMTVRNNSEYSFNLRDDNTSYVENVVMQNNTNYGIYMRNRSMPTINNCVIDNSGRGIEAAERSDFNISNSVIKNNTNVGIYIDNCYVKVLNNTFDNNGSAGLYVHNWSESRIENCTFTNNPSIGIDFYHNNRRNCWVKNSVIKNNGNGIRLQYQNSVLVEKCRVENNIDYGIRLSEYTTNAYNTLVARNNIIRNNRIGFYTDQRYNNVTLFRNDLSFNQSHGIYNWDGNNTLKAEYNTIFGNLYDGAYLRIGQTEHINGNIFANNLRFGIQLAENCNIETFNNNILYNNTTNVNNYALLPLNSYQYVTVDEYGDSVDVYKNKSIDPAFNFKSSVDLTLSPESHCINNGNEFLRDPDESIIDLGAYYYDLGCPHNLWVTGTYNSSVGLAWEPTVLEGASGYNVYYKLQEAVGYTFYQFTNTTSINVTGLTNNANYDFAIKTVFPGYTSIFSKKVSAVPGIPTMTIDPATLYAYLPDGVTSTDKTIEVSNNGTKDLNVSFNYFESGSAYFNGSSYIHYGDYSAWDFLTAFTMEAWVKRQNNGHLEFMGKAYDRFAFYVGSGSNYIGIYKAYGNRYTYSGRQEFTSNYSLPANEWHHLAATWSGNSVKFYVDGELVQEFTNADARMVPGSGRNFQLGRRADENNYYLQGF
ncbi:MAG TPA: right-handed parallel beta-helix repeat-containing protein, partial [Candidatus Kapabacteria bacterium]|nr:right-handed parallel beta-helix repeat-containing protein [Candidatus Kapabacteria bacterium]